MRMKLWYEKFGFSENPFKLSTNPKFFVGLENVRNEILERISSEDIILVTGETGCGKTTLLRWIKKKGHRTTNNKFVFLGLSENRTNRKEAEKHTKRTFFDRLFNKNYIILLDEAKDIRKEYCEFLKELTERPNTHVKSIIMTNINNNLPNLTDSFKKRISAKINLKPTKEDLKKMVLRRIKCYGKNPFLDSAIDEIIVRSGMNPRDVLKKCEDILMKTDKTERIDEKEVEKVLRRLEEKKKERKIEKAKKETKEEKEQTPIPKQETNDKGMEKNIEKVKTVIDEVSSLENLTNFQREILDILGTRERNLNDIREIYNQRNNKNVSKGSVAKQLSVLSMSSDKKRMRNKGFETPIVLKRKEGRRVFYKLADKYKTLFVEE